MKLITVALCFLAFTAASGQLRSKNRNPDYAPALYQSRATIRSMIGIPDKVDVPESYWAKFASSDRITLGVSVRSEEYTRHYGDIPYYLDVFYGVEGAERGLISPARAVGFSLTPYVEVSYPDLLPTVPWFKPLCAAGCDEMQYFADGQRFALICPPHPPAKDLDEARRLPLVPCIRVDWLSKKSHIFIIHYAEFRPALEEILAEGEVRHQVLDAEYAPR